MARLGYNGIESSGPSTSPGSQHWNIHTDFKERLKFHGSQVRPPAAKIRWFEQISGGLRTSVNTFYVEYTKTLDTSYRKYPVLSITRMNKPTVLNKSPTHLATIRTMMTGRPNVMSPVHSRSMTVRLMVIRTVPPNWQAAPINAYLATLLLWKYNSKFYILVHR